MREITVKIYKFDELSDKAKEKARQWYRESAAGDSYFSEPVIDDAKTILEFLGWKITNVPWSGFSSQGDGACFEGTWQSSDVKPGKATEYAPKDETLRRIAEGFEKVAKDHSGATCSVKHSGHYCHENCTEFEVSDDPEKPAAPWPEDELIGLSKDAMRWIYRNLEKEWEYEDSDEHINEIIRINEYEFTEDGKRA